MKTLYFLIIGLLMISGVASAQSVDSYAAQVQSAVDEELPVIGVRYYYYPNLDAYFDTHTNLYTYQQQGQWVKASQIPSGYRGYSVLNNIRVSITDYNGDEPFSKLAEHREKFPKKYAAKRKPPKIVQTESKVAYN